MFEVEEHPVLLHQPRDEIVRCLLILNTVWDGIVGFGQLELEIREAAVVQHLADDVLGRFLVKDLRTRLARQQPGPRFERKGIDHVATLPSSKPDLAANAVPISDSSGIGFHFDMARFPDDHCRINFRLARVEEAFNLPVKMVA